MTVEEHMEFYGGVKGHLSTLDTKREIRKWVNEGFFNFTLAFFRSWKHTCCLFNKAVHKDYAIKPSAYEGHACFG